MWRKRFAETVKKSVGLYWLRREKIEINALSVTDVECKPGSAGKVEVFFPVGEFWEEGLAPLIKNFVVHTGYDTRRFVCSG